MKKTKTTYCKWLADVQEWMETVVMTYNCDELHDPRN